ncbi:MAG: metalloregulator ArsR/SmtB family transcription factor [Acidobacteriaceae bacterium]|nr:metalloregulator ArsR/SmtB family transcription factor [Acidobacteriaceae bacterium]
MIHKQQFNAGRFFQALGDETRLRLLNLIGEREICVCHLVEVLGVPQPKISRHLAYLRAAGLVAARREGKWMHYRILMPQHPGAAAVLQQTLALLGEDRAMQTDLVRLVKACCLPKDHLANGNLVELHRRLKPQNHTVGLARRLVEPRRQTRF